MNTTRGRSSNNLRRTALIYGRAGAGFVVVGTSGGHKHRPNWYLNLTKNPNLDVQVKKKEFRGLVQNTDGDHAASSGSRW